MSFYYIHVKRKLNIFLHIYSPFPLHFIVKSWTKPLFDLFSFIWYYFMSLDVVWHVLLMQVAPNNQTWHLTYLWYVVINVQSETIWVESLTWWYVSQIFWNSKLTCLVTDIHCMNTWFQQHIMHRKENKSFLSMVHRNSTKMIANWI